MKTKILSVILLAALGVTAIALLEAASDSPNKEANGFNRTIVQNEFKIDTFSLSQDHDVQSICGLSGDTLFLSHKAPNKITMIVNHFDSLIERKISLPDIENLTPVFFTNVSYPDVYIMGGNAKKIVHANLNDNNYALHKYPFGAFSQAIAKDANCYYIRAIDKTSLNVVITKYTPSSNTVEIGAELQPELRDAGFTNEGMFNYDRQSNHVFYVNYYSNNIICFDTTLKLIYQSKTIDTNNYAKIFPKKNGSKVINSRPPVIINRFSFISNGNLFILSNLMADNENKYTFSQNVVIDRYDANNGKYLNSTYLPIKNDRQLIGLKGYENYFIALYKNYIIKYEPI